MRLGAESHPREYFTNELPKLYAIQPLCNYILINELSLSLPSTRRQQTAKAQKLPIMVKKNPLEKFYSPYRDSDQHQNRMVSC